MTQHISTLAAFKAYDIRGRVPEEVNMALAYDIGRAFAASINAYSAVVGRDIRLSSDEISAALIEGLRDSGVAVTDIGLCGTEEVYFATAHLGVDGGIMVTASHNPKDYNGMKLVRAGAAPISGDSGLAEIESRVREKRFNRGDDDTDSPSKGDLIAAQPRDAYVDHLLSCVDLGALKGLKIVANAGNGCAGAVVDALEAKLPFDLIKIHHEADGTFPNGVPNPLLPQNRGVTAEAVRQHQADFGIAWDGDFDRCFFFDEQGRFIEGYYIVGLLAAELLRRHPGSAIIHDPRLIWNTIDLVQENSGRAVVSKTGHAFIKERMRKENALYGGEMSAHHYFRDFFYCDSGMLPWLYVAAALSRGGCLSQQVGARQAKFPVSGEINQRVGDPKRILAAIEAQYCELGGVLDRTDGISIAFDTWRFNLRMSNTEPLIRLNVESRANEALMNEKTAEVLSRIEAIGATPGDPSLPG